MYEERVRGTPASDADTPIRNLSISNSVAVPNVSVAFSSQGRGEAADYLETTAYDPGARAPYTVPPAPIPSFDDPDIDYNAINLDNPVPDAMYGDSTSASMTESAHAEPAPIFKLKEMYQGEEEQKRYQALRKAGATYEQFQKILNEVRAECEALKTAVSRTSPFTTRAAAQGVQEAEDPLYSVAIRGRLPARVPCHQ